MDKNSNSQLIGEELIVKGREVYSKNGNHRFGWLRDFPQQSGGSSGGVNTATLEGPELVIRGRQVFSVNDSTKPIGYLADEFANLSTTGGSSGTQSQQQTR